MPRRLDPQIAESLNRAAGEFMGKVLGIGARATRAVAESVVDDVADLAEEGARRLRRAARKVGRPKLPDE